jgi:Fur family ferric uptake transcriptional regulator
MTTAVTNLFTKLLSDHNQSVTKPRLLVFDQLVDKEPQTIAELYKELTGSIDRVTLYRTIDLFEKLGIVQRVYVGWKYKIELTDLFSHHHHHISCLTCGKLSAITEDHKLEALITELARRQHFTAQRHQIEIQGLCNDCHGKAEQTASH